ncbi:MAG TPA: glycine cleavage T C-terminal barrel domain-containing protein [Kineosporiaceae bacterium]
MESTSPSVSSPAGASAALPSRLLDVPGAVGAQGRDAGVAWHYGDPSREQRLLANGEAVTDLSHCGVLRLTGPDRLKLLHAVTTQHLAELPAGTPTEALVLSPHGHVEHDLHLVDDGESSWIIVEPGTSAALEAWLARMRFLLEVDVTDVTADWAVLGVVAVPGLDPAAPVAAALGGRGLPPAWQDPWPVVAPGSVAYSDVPLVDHPGSARPWREVLVPRAEVAARLAGVPLAGTWASEALRIAAWRPRLGMETDHRTIPHEVDWLRTAVHLAKGCYRGQETVARVHNLGRPPRRLVMLHLDGSEHTLPAPGDPVVLGGRPVGHVTSAARHHELGPIALAMVKRSTPADATLTAGGVAAAQEPVVRS